VYFVTKRKGTDNPDWIKVGVGWVHQDEDGINIALNNLGQSVILTVCPNKPKAD